MRAGQHGPDHEADREQVWTVLEGSLRVSVNGESLLAGAGDALLIAAHVPRQITAPTSARALVASPAGAWVIAPDGPPRPLPWAT